MADPQLPPGPEEQLDLGFQDDSLELMEKYYQEYGDIYKVYSPFRKRYTYIINNPVYIKQVLVTNNRNYTKGVGLDRVKILLGNGIMVSEGDYWRRQRRMIQPAFHRKVIRKFSQMMREHNRQLLRKWTEKAERGALLNITEEMSQITLDIVLSAIFSVDLDELVQHTGKNPFHLVTEESNRDLQFAMRFRGLAKYINQFADARREENRTEYDFLSMLMHATDKETGEHMTRKELIDEMMTLIVAGHETTASVLNWTWYLLATHPQIADRHYEEIRRLQGDAPEFEYLPNYTFNRQVLEESMRLYPPGWLLTRRAIDEDMIGEFYVHPKTDIFISPYIIQRSGRYWDNPKTFIPERFEDERTKERHKFTYFPFSAGPRQCIGDFFALVEMQIHLALLARRFRMEYVEKNPIELEPQVNLRTKHPIFLRPVLR